MTEAHGPFESGEGPGQVTLAQRQHATPPRGIRMATGVSNCLDNLESFIPQGTALRERPQFGMAHGEVGTGVHGGRDDPTKALVAPCSVEGRYGLLEAVDRPTIVALELVGYAEILVYQRVQDDIPAGRGQRKGALGGGDGLVMRAYEVEMA